MSPNKFNKRKEHNMPHNHLSCSLKMQIKQWSPSKGLSDSGVGPEAACLQSLGDMDGSGAFSEKPDRVDDEYAPDQ